MTADGEHPMICSVRARSLESVVVSRNDGYDCGVFATNYESVTGWNTNAQDRNGQPLDRRTMSGEAFVTRYIQNLYSQFLQVSSFSQLQAGKN